MESLLEDWDGETVVTRRDRPTGTWIFIAIHSTRLGPAVGGTRMKPYSDPATGLRDALRLAAGMTYKFAVPGLPFGGGKAVLAIPRGLDPEARTGLLRRYGSLIQQLNGTYRTAPDVGTSSADMDIIAETGAPYVYARSEAAGGSGPSGPSTALGVFTGIQAACQHLFGDPSPEGRQVLVQGAGSVGGPLIERLLDAGADVLFSEVDPATIHRYRDELGVELVEGSGVSLEEPAAAVGALTGTATRGAPVGDALAQLPAIECDIFSPCALGGGLDAETIPRLRCKAVVGGANNQLASAEDEDLLQARGILYAPDYVVNVGGAMAGLAMETRGLSREEADGEVVENVGRVLRQIFETAASQGITTGAAARRIAEERLSHDPP
jgi:glutamate dehydrogenase/leucine dehydrogenase